MSKEFERLKEKPRTEIHISVKSVKGFCGACNNVGSKWITEPRGMGYALPRPVDGGAEICAEGYHSIFPTVLGLQRCCGIAHRYEGSEYDDPDIEVDFVACPDPANAVVYEVRRVVVDE